jgi:DTW domain-containing protein YfiP
METHNPKGTARLLHLSLPGSQLLTGEVFAPDVLAAALARPTADGQPVQTLLLYPADPVTVGEALVTGAGQASMLDATRRVRLVVLDGTWRKSRKMLHTNPMLQALPRYALQAVPPSRYVIRKAHAAHQLSTLEATCAALAQLEEATEGGGNVEKFQPLLDAMDGLMAQQLAFSRSAGSVI